MHLILPKPFPKPLWLIDSSLRKSAYAPVSMKATKVTIAPKATKSEKTMKAPKSVKTMKAATAKGKSQKAKDKSPDKKRGPAIGSYHLYDLKRKGERTISILGKTSKINFFYGATPCTKTPEQLKKMAAMIVPVLKARQVESKALQVHAFFAAPGVYT